MPVLRDIDVLREVEQTRKPMSAARERLRAEALALARDEQLVDAAFAWRIVGLEGPAGDVLCVDGERLHAPWLLPASGTLTAVACAVGTIGERLTARAHALFEEKRRAVGVALDELGNELLFALSRRGQDRMLADAKKQGLSMAGELRAGDPGLALEAQTTVLRLAGAHEIGVTLTAHHMMRPVKSTSMVIGVGLELPAARWSRCDACRSREHCEIVRNAAIERGQPERANAGPA